MKIQSPIRTMEDFRDAAYGFRVSRIIATALDLDIFTKMDSRWLTTKHLAKSLKANERGVEILVRNLEAAGLLKKRGVTFRVSKVAKMFLDRNSLQYQGAYLDLLHHQWENWAGLTNAVRTGRPIENDGPDDPDYRRSFTWAMHQRSQQTAKQVAAQLNLRNAKSLLDVGGGPGTYALEFLKRNPKLEVGVWDREPALEVARTIAESLRLRDKIKIINGKRLSYYPGDLFKSRVPGKFDVMWFSNVLHIFSPNENKTIFRKLNHALNPGGRILIQDTFLMDKPGFDAVETNLFAVTMLLYTSTGNTYSAKEVQRWLKCCGFQKTRFLKMKKGTGDWDGVIVEGRKS